MYSTYAHICLHGLKICKITYVEHDESSFEYVFEPDYEVIDSLSSFRGIQGIDLSLRMDKYVRRNMIPSFLFEHRCRPGIINFQHTERIDGLCLLDYLVVARPDYFGDNMYVDK